MVDCFARNIFAPESAIDSGFLIEELGGALIQFIKIILGLLISIVLIIAPKRHP